MRQVCSKELPYSRENTLPENTNQQWSHPEARETDFDSDYAIEYRCPICLLVFRTEMPD